ncbi:hypothetical protein AAE02nite_03210 [Adhaeribacter aerolatus]|uniref:Uncharacterized protein n=1 Tax=Adhaeribacter aerolatus TaxID=670289 RepID=A0A512ASV7_9BACT|nr:hypothetical protein [Adhaeribacter aerolatus]GEO02657.1 hypothetical protein AAE02nite_03210 [Adhaeribacter aerolatus]
MMNKKQVMIDLYFEAGAGLYDSQVIEYNFKYLIYLLSKTQLWDGDRETAKSILDGKTKHTLGQLFKFLRDKRILFLPDTEERLEDALAARNNLIHEYLAKNVALMMTKEGRHQMIKEIIELRKRIQQGNKSVSELIEALLEPSVGKDKLAAIDEDLEKQFEKENW